MTQAARAELTMTAKLVSYNNDSDFCAKLGVQEMAESANLQEIIRVNIERIRSIVQDCSTESVVGYSMLKQLDGFPQPGLSSPTKQIRFLLGVMLETEEPSNPIEFTKQKWEQFLDPIQRLVHAYMLLYLPTEGSLAEQSEDWSRSRQVSMVAFLDYHQKGLLASGEQVSGRIRSCLVNDSYFGRSGSCVTVVPAFHWSDSWAGRTQG